MLDVSEVFSAAGVAFSCVPAPSNPFLLDSDGPSWLCRLEGGPVEGFEFHLTSGTEPDVTAAVTLLLLDVRSYRDCDGYGDFARLLGIDEDDPVGRPSYEEAARLSGIVAPVQSLVESMEIPSLTA